MPDYSKGKIYKIWSVSTDKIYIGSTTQTLSMRMGGHRREYKRFLNGKKHYTTSFDILELGDAKIELIEDYPCNSKEELVRREGKFIRELECVNRCVAGRTTVEYYQDNKERLLEASRRYNQENKERIIEYQRRYRQENRDIYNERCRRYYHKNKKYHRNYYQKNKGILGKKITCECGSIVRYDNLSNHKKSLKHQKYLSDNIE